MIDEALKLAVERHAEITAIVCMDRRAGVLVGCIGTADLERDREGLIRAFVPMPGEPDLVFIGLAKPNTTTTSELTTWLEELAGTI